MGLHLVKPREDRTSAINIATYALTGAFLAVFIARQVMKAIVFRRVALDDLFILLATVRWLLVYKTLHLTLDRPLRLVCRSPRWYSRPNILGCSNICRSIEPTVL